MPEGHPSSLSGAFRKPFSAQIAFFRRKLANQVPTRRWNDLKAHEHDHAFMVAGAMAADLLSDLAAAVDRTIAEGKSLEAFRKDFRAIVARNGWHGWTGEDTAAGRAWRTRTIYRTNAATSYAAGRYAQLKEGGYAFWVYRHGNAREPRIIHLSWDGLTLPPDHDWWREHYPPSAWGCTCYVVGARSERAAARLGGDPSKTLPAGWRRINPATGEPDGVAPGWGYAPGAGASPVVQAMAAKIGSWDYRIAKAFMDSVPEAQRAAIGRSYRDLPSVADDARRYAARVLDGASELAPIRTLGLVGDLADPVTNATGLKDIDGYDFTFDPSVVQHINRRHGDPAREARQGQRAITADDYARLPEILNAPDAVLSGQTVESAQGARGVIFEKQIGDATYRAVFVPRGRKRQTFALQTLFVKVKI